MRILSFLIALSVAAFVIIYPRAIASDMSSVPHGWLVLLLLGMSFCFVYGVGFKARNRFLAFLFSPLVGLLREIESEGSQGRKADHEENCTDPS